MYCTIYALHIVISYITDGSILRPQPQLGLKTKLYSRQL